MLGINSMNRPITTKTYEDIQKYNLVLGTLERKFPRCREHIDSVKLLVRGLAAHRWLFGLQQYETVLNFIRVEHDYSRLVTLIGRELKASIRHPGITITEKSCLRQLYLISGRCLKRAFEFFIEAEEALVWMGKKIYVGGDEAFNEYERASGSLWKFQHEFHMQQLDIRNGSARAIIFASPTSSGSPVSLNSSEISVPDWKEPEEDKIQVLTEAEQNECRTLSKNLSALSVLPNILKDRNSSLSSLGDEDEDNLKPSTAKSMIVNHMLYRPSGNLKQRRRGVLKTESNRPPRNDPSRRVTFDLPESFEDASSPSTGDLKVFPSNAYLGTKDPSSSSSSHQPSPSSSSSLPSISSISPLLPSPATKKKPDDSGNSGPSNGNDGMPEISPRSFDSEQAFLERAAAEISREVVLSTRAYLGHRHNEDCVELAAEPGTGPGKEKHAMHQLASRAAHEWSSQSVKWTALLHWASVSRARRRERIAGRARVRALVRRASSMGGQPLPPGCANIRPGLFAPLGPPDLAAQQHDAWDGVDPDEYREATLANLARLRTRLDLTLLAFSFNQDALRLYGGLVGEKPRARDLARMDGVLRELEVYTAVCAHRRGLIVGHLKQTREFPVVIAAQFGDLRAAYADTQEDKLAAARRCFEYVADRSRHVMTYQGKRRKREFAGRFSRRDHEKLRHLSETHEEAERLLSELDAAEEWQSWCRNIIGHWTLGWRPDRVEQDMLYVDEVVEGDVRRYKRDINDKRAALGLAPVERPQDAVFERQQEQIRLLDGLWRLMA